MADYRDTVDVIDAVAVRRWCRTALDGLAAAREEIDALNVYPVPDGDTGTNLYLTVEAAWDALEVLPADADLASTATALARGALLGARGSSGVICSQLLCGIAARLREPGPADATVVAGALGHAADLAYAAVARPVEGTMLSVARAAGDAAAGAATRDGTVGALEAVVLAAAHEARAALRRTPDQLEVLHRSGVVDAGGRGVCVLLDALVEVVTGTAPVPTHPTVRRPAGVGGSPAPHPADGGGSSPAYEVMYLLDAPDHAVPRLRSRLDHLGGSLVVVGGEGLWNVHVHVDDVGAAIEAGVATGRPHRIRVTRLDDVGGGGSAAGAHRAGARDDGHPGHLPHRAVVSVVAGDGLAALFASAGARTLSGGHDGELTADEVLAGIRGSRAGEVVVLPSDPDSQMVAEAAGRQARREGVRVAVVPVAATVQALAALAVHDPTRCFDDDVVHMATAASHCRHGAVTIATSDAWTMAGRCRAGDVLGVVDGDFAVIGTDLVATACQVVDRMLVAGGEMVTLVTGAADAAVHDPRRLAEQVIAHVAAERPEVDALIHDGGQPRYPLLIGVE